MTVPSFRTMGVALMADTSDLTTGLRRAQLEVDRFAERSAGAFDRVDRGLGNAQRDAAALGRSMSGSFKSAEDSARSFERELERVEAEQRSLAQTQMRAEKEMAADFEQRARKREDAMNRLGIVAVGVGVALGAGVGVGIDRFATFDQEISAVEAATHETAAGMRALSDASLQAGQDTVFSATESAAAVENLAKAGVGTSDILSGALTGSLNLAAAGTLDVAYAAEIAATAMTQFGKDGQDVPHIADLLAAAAGKAQGEVSDMAEALKFVGPVAAGMNISLEETVGTLALFAQQGVIGEQAGTGLRGMLASLTSPSKQAADEMDRLGINLYDANGNFIGIAGAAEQLRNGLVDLTGKERDAALGMIFGNQQVTAARILYKGGAEAVDEWTSNVNDAGYASETAAIKLDNLKGDVEQFSGALETSLIKSGTSANGVLRAMVQSGTGVLNLYSELPGPVQATGTVLTSAASAATLLSGAFILGAPKVAEFKKSISDMGPRAQTFSRGILSVGNALSGPLGIGLAAAVIGLGIYAKKQAEVAAGTQDFAQAVLADAGAIDAQTEARIRARLEETGALQAADKLGLAHGTVTRALTGNADAQDEVNAALKEYLGVIGGAAGGTEEQRAAALKLANAMGTLKPQIDGGVKSAAALLAEQKALGGTTDDTTRATNAYGESVTFTTEAMEAAQKAADDWQKELTALAQGFVTPLDAYQEALKAKEDAERTTAEATASATKSGKDSWEDYSHEVTLSIDEYLDKLAEQIKAQDDWRANLLLLSTRVSEPVLAELERLGEEGAPLIAKLVNATPKEFRRLERLMGGATREAASAVASELIAAAPVLTAVAEADGQKVADGYARKLAEGKTTIEEIADKYGLALQEGIPDRVETKVSISGASQAKRIMRELAEQAARLNEATITIGVGRFGGKALPSYADGGQIYGPGTGTSDSILARVSTGEFVQPKAAVDYYGPGVHEAIRRMTLPRSVFTGVPGYAGGGMVGRPAPAPNVSVTVTAPAAAGRQGPLIGEIHAHYPAPERVGESVQMQLAAVAHSYGLDLGD